MASNRKNGIPISLQLLRWMFRLLTPIVPQLMGRIAYKMWFTPMRANAPDREIYYAKTAKTHYITVNSLKIKVWSWGAGPTVLFIHGWGGRGTQISCFIDKLTSEGFNVMAFDLPAHGESQGHHTDAFSIARVTDEIMRQIDNLHSVITHSFGGVIFGYAYQPTFPIQNAVMICPPATLDTALNQFSDTLKLPAVIQDHIANQLRKSFGEEVFDKLSLLNNATQINVPVLIVHDKQDDVVPFEDGQRIHKALKNAAFLESCELGHRKILYDTNIVNKVVEFILKHSNIDIEKM